MAILTIPPSIRSGFSKETLEFRMKARYKLSRNELFYSLTPHLDLEDGWGISTIEEFIQAPIETILEILEAAMREGLHPVDTMPEEQTILIDRFECGLPDESETAERSGAASPMMEMLSQPLGVGI